MISSNQTLKENASHSYLKGLFLKYSFFIIVGIAMYMAFWVKGVVFSGMFMGIMITIAMWTLVAKFPEWLLALMGRHILISDLLLTICSSFILGTIGPGPTILMGTATVAVLLSILLNSLSLKYAYSEEA